MTSEVTMKRLYEIHSFDTNVKSEQVPEMGTQVQKTVHLYSFNNNTRSQDRIPTATSKTAARPSGKYKGRKVTTRV